MTREEIQETVARLESKSVFDEDAAWVELRPLGIAVVPYLVEAYPVFRRWRGRASLLYHSIRYARESEAAYQLGLTALSDRSWVVRHWACGLLAYSLRAEAVPYLQPLLDHNDARTAADAAAAIRAIEMGDHNQYKNRGHASNTKWRVGSSDAQT